MPNYFYIDQSGQKQGPVNEQQLKTLATQGIITPETQLKTESGHTGKAAQIHGLNFPNLVQRPEPTAIVTRDIAMRPMPWLFDIPFSTIKLPDINRKICAIIYGIALCGAVLFLLIGTGGILWAFLSQMSEFLMDQASSFMSASQKLLMFASIFAQLFGIVFLWLGTAISIICLRLICEWWIILFDCILLITQAARRYVSE